MACLGSSRRSASTEAAAAWYGPDFRLRQELTATRKWMSDQLSVGESIQGVCFQEDLFRFIEKLATQ